MARKQRAKGRFVGIPFSVANSHPFGALKASEVKLLIDLLVQYNGRNNGNLTPALAVMAPRGWSASSLWRAKTGLIEKGFIVVTRQGEKRRGKPTLVAITWNEIDECTVVFDAGIKPSATPLNNWCKGRKEKPTTNPKLRVVGGRK